MEWQSLDELRASLGVVAARLVRAWKTKSPINGLTIESERIDGEQMWRAVPQRHPLSDSPVHGRTVNALADAGLVYAEDVVELVGEVDEDTAASLLTKFNGVGAKGASDVVEWLDTIGLRTAPSVATPEEGEGSIERNATDGELVHREYEITGQTDVVAEESELVPSQDSEPATSGGSDTPEPTSSDSPPTDGEGSGCPFGELPVEHGFSYETRHGVVTFRKSEKGRREDNGAPFNAYHVDGEFPGKPCFFTNDTVVTPVQLEEPSKEEPPEEKEERPTGDIRLELHERFNAWLATTYTRSGRSGKLDTYDDDVLSEVRQLLRAAIGHAYMFDTIHSFRLGHEGDMPPQFLTAVKRVLAGEVDLKDDDLDFTFDDVHQGPGYRPCKCESPTLPADESGWVKCQSPGCDGYVRIEEEPDELRDLVAAAAEAEEFFELDELEEACEPRPNSPADVGFAPPTVTHVEASHEQAAMEARIAPAESLWPEPEDEEEDEVDPFDILFPGDAVPEPSPANTTLHPALSDCRVLAQHEADTEEWHAARALGIGSSDAGGLIGVSPHATPLDVWRTKVGAPEAARPWLDLYGEFGTWFEPYLREHCELISGVRITPGAQIGTLQSTKWEKALANIDGLDELGVNEELKTSESEWEEIPEAYLAQVHHQMFVTGCTLTRLRQFVCPISRKSAMGILNALLAVADVRDAFAQWLLDNGEVVTWVIERDEKYIERLVEREKTFWTFVEAEIEPPEVEPDDTIDLTDDPEVYATMHEYARLHAGLDRYKSEKKVADQAKKKARKAIERAVALLEETPKRLTIGDHGATFTVKQTHSYWNLYPKGGADDGIIF